MQSGWLTLKAPSCNYPEWLRWILLFPQCPFICAFALGWILKQIMNFSPAPLSSERFFFFLLFFYRQVRRDKASSVRNEERTAIFVYLVSTEMNVIMCTIKKRVCESVVLYDTCFKTSNLLVPIGALIVSLASTFRAQVICATMVWKLSHVFLKNIIHNRTRLSIRCNSLEFL